MSFVKSIFNFLRFNKRNWKAVVLCIFAATVFWFFNALNKNYSTNISFPVTFEYDHERYMPVKPLPEHVRMNVTGSGWDLFRRSLGFKVPPLVVPLEKPSDVHKIAGAALPAIFAGQLERLKINFTITDTVRIHIEEKLRRKFSVMLDSVQQNLHPDFGLVNKPTLNPDTVWIEGPAAVLRKMPDTMLLTFPQNNIRKGFNEPVDVLFAQNNLLTAQPQKISVAFEVEKFTQVEKQINLTFINIPARLKQGTLKREISCIYRLPGSMVNTFTGDSLQAVIDLRDKQKGTYWLVPRVVGLPPNAVIVKTDSVQVNF